MQVRRLPLMVGLLLLVLALAGCPDDKPMPTLDIPDGIELDGETQGDQADVVEDLEPEVDVVDVTDVSDIPDVEPDEVTPPDPQLEVCVSTPSGCETTFAQCLTLDDDKYPAMPGVQVDIFVTPNDDVPPGANVELWLNGNLVDDLNNPGAQFSFNQVSLAHKPDGHNIEVRVQGLVNVALDPICVETGACGITLEPANDECLMADSDENIAGFQAAFVITSDGTDCDEAWLSVDGEDVPAEPQALDDTGAATIVVTVPGDELVCLDVEVIAHVGDSANPERNTQLDPLTYIADNTPPLVTIDEPTAQSVNLLQDEDPELDGIQVTVAGTLQAVGNQDIVELYVDGEQVAVATATAEYEFITTLTEPGPYDLEVRATDCCDNVGSATKTLIAIFADSDLSIVSPGADDVLYAKDNGDTGTATVYATDFTVLAPVAAEGETLEIRCKEDAEGTFYTTVGSLTLEALDEEWLYTVPVNLDTEKVDNLMLCRVRLDQDGTITVSPAISVTVALPPPILTIIEPAAGALVDTAALLVSGTADNLAGQTVTVTLSGDEEMSWTTTADDEGFQLQVIGPGDNPPEGLYTLSVEATDGWGNLASDQEGSFTQVDVWLDHEAPTVSFLSPQDGETCTPPGCADAIADDVLPGHQLEVSLLVEGEAAPEQVLVCLVANGVEQPPCAAPVDSNGQQIATFYGVTLMTGENILVATATDGLGHPAEPVTAVVTLNVDAPRVTFVAPTGDVVTGTEPVEIVASVTSPDGTTPLADASVTLQVGGIDYDTVDAGPGGQYSFEVSGLTPNVATLLQLSADHTDYALTGYSDLRKATLKDVAPGIALTFPEDESLFNLAATGCAPGFQGCKLTVTGSTENVEDGQQAELTRNCVNAGSATYFGTVSNDAVSFANVALPDNDECTLLAQVEDKAGQLATAQSVTVTIDRTAPTLSEFNPSTALVPANFDEDDQAEGFQYSVEVKVSGVAAGTVVSLLIEPEEGDSTTLEATVAQDVADDQLKKVTFEQFTYAEGANTLTASVTDAAGNSASLGKDFLFFSDPTELKFSNFDVVEYLACTSSSECGVGVCAPVAAGKRCVTPWKNAKQVLTVFSTPAELFTGSTLRICSNHPGLAPLTDETCNDTSEGLYRVLNNVDVMGADNVLLGGYEVLEFGKTTIQGLPQGEHRIFLEALSAEGKWVSSQTAQSEEVRVKVLFVDTQAPVVDGVAFTGDTNPADGWLNLAESITDTIFAVSVEITGAASGSADVTINGIGEPQLAVTDAQAQLALELELFQGANEVCATAQDLVGNKSAQVCADVNVDTLAPGVSFVYPSNKPTILATDSTDVIVSTDPNLPVALGLSIDGVASTLEGTANAQGSATFAGALSQDGTYAMSASATDGAGNVTTVLTTPPSIVVDLTAPTAAITAPVDGAALAEGDDAAPGQAGFQVQVDLTLDGNATWSVETVRCTDAAYTQCEEAVLKSSGNETGAVSTTVTLGKLLQATEYRIIRATATDAAGNETVAEVKISVQPGDCIVAFTNLPEATYLNNEDFCDPAGSDCASAQVDVQVLVAGACGDADSLVLYVNDVPTDQSDAFAQGPVTFTVNVADGDNIQLEARLLFEGAETGNGTGQSAYTADFTDPVPVFLSPDTEPFLCNQASDLNGGLAGCQFSPQVEVSGDNLAGGSVAIYRLQGEQEVLLDEAVLGASPFATTFSELTLPEAENVTLLLRAEDVAGNRAELTLAAASDVTPPAAIALNEIDTETDINRRRPSVRLTWDAVGDDGLEGGAADAYEFRYSFTPIINEQDFADACDPTELVGTGAAPTPEAPGSLESFDITGPDVRAPNDPCRFVMQTVPDTEVWFAARAVDEAGNNSPITAQSITTTTDMGLAYSRINTENMGAPALGSDVSALGDLNGDLMTEFAVGGDTAFPGFCIVRGHTNFAAEIVLSDATNDPYVQCVEDTYVNWEGYQLAPVGDVNGDGIVDVGSQVFVNPAEEYSTFYKVYLGDGTGFVQEPAALSLIFTGQDYYLGQIQAAGNFNGDAAGNGNPLDDIAVGVPELNRVYVIPGNEVWKSSAPVTIDLLNQDHLDAWNVLVIEGTGMLNNAQFGDNAVAVGNLLTDNDGEGTQYDDLVIAKTQGPANAYVLKGRAFTESALVSLSRDLDGSGTDDAMAVRLRKSAGVIGEWYFGTELPGGRDLDGDGLADIAVLHTDYSVVADSQVYLFYGAAIAANLGGMVTIGNAVDAGNGVFVGPNGMRFSGAYSYVDFSGNFDNVPSGPGLSVDLVMADYAYAPVLGNVYVRLNQQENATAGNLVPYVDLVITDPFTPGSPDFSGFGMDALGDVNGDGMPDLIVATKSSGYAVLVH